MDALLEQTSRSDIISHIGSMVANDNASEIIRQAYIATLTRVKAGRHHELAGRTIACVTFAFRPLNLLELQHAVSVVDKRSDNILADDLKSTKIILDSCVGLVRLGANSTRVRLVHETTQQFFETLEDEWFEPYKSYPAIACARYCLMPAHNIKASSSHPQRSTSYHAASYLWLKGAIYGMNDEYPFHNYAKEYWVQHTDQAGPKHWTSLLVFLQHNVLVETTIGYYTGRGGKAHRGSAWMHLLAMLGLEEMLYFYLRSVDSDGSYMNIHNIPTSAEAMDQNLQRNTRCLDDKGYTAAVYAVEGQHLQLVESILNWCNQPQALVVTFLFALRARSTAAALALTQRVKNGAVLSDNNVLTLVNEAIMMDSKVACALVLLERYTSCLLNMKVTTSVDTPAQQQKVGNEPSSAKDSNSRELHREVLMSQEVYRQLAWYASWNPQDAAKAKSHLIVIKHILAQHCDNLNAIWVADQYGGKQQPLLHTAWSRCDLGLVNHLSTFENLDYNIIDSEGETVLMIACQACVRYDLGDTAEALLIKLCSKVNIHLTQPETKSTALHIFARAIDRRRGVIFAYIPHLLIGQVFDAMLDAGADPNAIDSDGLTPLDIAWPLLTTSGSTEVRNKGSRHKRR